MLKFIIKIGIILISLFLLNLFLFNKVKELYLNSYLIKEVPAYRNFLFADSHGEVLRQKLQVGGIFNFSAGSDSYVDILRKLRFLNRQLEKIDTVYLTVDNHTLAQYRNRLNNDPRSIFYTEMNWDNFLDQSLKRYLVYSNPTYIDLIKESLKDSFTKQVDTKKETVRSWQDFSTIERTSISLSRYGVQFDGKDASFTVSKALREIIEYCKLNSITIIGIKFPLDGIYLDVIDGLNYKADALLKEEGYDVWDYSKVFDKEPFYFNDPDHLNQAGSKVLADQILKRLRNSK